MSLAHYILLQLLLGWSYPTKFAKKQSNLLHITSHHITPRLLLQTIYFLSIRMMLYIFLFDTEKSGKVTIYFLVLRSIISQSLYRITVDLKKKYRWRWMGDGEMTFPFDFCLGQEKNIDVVRIYEKYIWLQLHMQLQIILKLIFEYPHHIKFWRTSLLFLF